MTIKSATAVWRKENPSGFIGHALVKAWKTLGRTLSVVLPLTQASVVLSSDLLVYDIVAPARTARNLPLSEGFGALNWGTSIEEAQRIYNDLREDDSPIYKQYIKGGKENSAEFIREKEDLTVGGYRMDSVSYSFERGKFVAVSLALSCSKNASCDIDKIHENIVTAIRRIYGKPHKIGSRTFEDEKTISKHGGLLRVSEIEWKLDDESININKRIDPSYSYLSISIFSYNGYFKAIGQQR